MRIFAKQTFIQIIFFIIIAAYHLNVVTYNMFFLIVLSKTITKLNKR